MAGPGWAGLGREAGRPPGGLRGEAARRRSILGLFGQIPIPNLGVGPGRGRVETDNDNLFLSQMTGGRLQRQNLGNNENEKRTVLHLGLY